MSNPAIGSLIACGTKLYLDSIDPDLVVKNIEWGAVGATSNPIIIGALIDSGRFDRQIAELCKSGSDDETIAWELTDGLVRDAQRAFEPIWRKSRGDDGWVSFELDPLIEDPKLALTQSERVDRYIELGRRWSKGHDNRMIKIPATAAGLAAVETLAADGVTLNVTLTFTMAQYESARDAIWRGVQRLASLQHFKSVYSIFVSRVDQYTQKHVPTLSPAAQGLVGIANAQEIWAANQAFWKATPTPLKQEIIFASTGTKSPSDPKTKYVAALAGSDIQTNPPETNDAIAESGLTFSRAVDRLPSDDVLQEIAAKVYVQHLHDTLMEEGIAKFVAPQRKLLQTIAEKRAALVT